MNKQEDYSESKMTSKKPSKVSSLTSAQKT